MQWATVPVIAFFNYKDSSLVFIFIELIVVIASQTIIVVLFILAANAFLRIVQFGAGHIQVVARHVILEIFDVEFIKSIAPISILFQSDLFRIYFFLFFALTVNIFAGRISRIARQNYLFAVTLLTNERSIFSFCFSILTILFCWCDTSQFSFLYFSKVSLAIR